MEIPVIDFSQLDGENRSKTMAGLHNACEKWGFFMVKQTLEIFVVFEIALCLKIWSSQRFTDREPYSRQGLDGEGEESCELPL